MNQTIETIKNLHSTRKYSKQNIPDEQIEIILDAAVSAGNSGNRQVYSILVIDDEKLLKKYFYGGNKALVFLIDFSRWVNLANHLKLDITSSIDGLRGFTISSMDAMIAAQNAALAAKSLGIESLFTTSLHRGDFEEIYEKLNLPNKYCFPYLSLALGYSDESKSIHKGRVKNGVIHYGKYKQMSPKELEDQIQEYDDDKNHLGFTSRENWEKAGFQHYLEFYFTKWSKSQPVDEIRSFYKVIADSGFLDAQKFL